MEGCQSASAQAPEPRGVGGLPLAGAGHPAAHGAAELMQAPPAWGYLEGFKHLSQQSINSNNELILIKGF